MPKYLVLILLATLVGCAMPQRVQYFGETRVAWISLDEGETLARSSGKPLLVDFFVREGCGRCEKMDANVYNDPEIAAYINANFVPVRIDLDSALTSAEAELGRRYDYNYECLLLVLDSDMNVINDSEAGNLCFAGAVEPQAFIGYLERTLAKN